MSDSFERNPPIDNYLEHELHLQLDPLCSECDREVRELTLEKRIEEAEQRERALLGDNFDSNWGNSMHN